MRCTAKVSKSCEHYRERMSECRNCDPSDAPYKICFLKKTYKKDALRSKTFREEQSVARKSRKYKWKKHTLTCKNCGKEFRGGSTANICPNCRKEANKENASRRYYASKN